MKTAALIALSLVLTGCASTSGARWYNPGTWFSGSEGRAVVRTEGKVEAASNEVLKAAQKTAHETQLALVAAPESRPVEVARESNDATVSALDQIAGPLTVAEVAGLRAQVAGLLSEVATQRAEAEQARQERRETLAEASTAIDELRAKLAAQQQQLKAGFERENAVANAYRNVKFALFGTAALALIAFVGLTYLRLAYGGIPQAIGRGLGELRLRDPKAGEIATQLFDSYLNRHEQRAIANAT